MMSSKLINGLPKVELHLHLEGSLRPKTMLRLAERNGVDLGVASAEELTGQYSFRNFDDFLHLFLQGLDVLRTAEDFADATSSLAEELAGQNVRYAEITTTPFNHSRRNLAMADYVDGLNEGRRRAAKLGVSIGWICDIPRELESPDAEFTVDLITGAGAPEGVIGLGLGGPEVGFPPELFERSFAKAKEAGLAAIPHAGETEGPDSIWGAIKVLGADRIGHGVRCLEDPALVAYLIEHQIPLEVSMTSNVSLAVVPSIEEHPLPQLLEVGAAVTLNTDDPAYFSTTLNDELKIASEVHGVSDAALVEMQRTAVRSAYASDDLKQEILAELAAFDAGVA